MKFEEINSLIKGIPFIQENNAKKLYDTIIENKFKNCLELGFAHGVASCYIAAALDELGSGNLVSVDLIAAKVWQKPTIESLLEKTGLSKYVEVIRMQTGYTWFLHNEIAKNTKSNYCDPEYDICIIDGPKNWTIDGCAFFLVDKLLKENGWIIFDDYNFTYDEAEKQRTVTDGITHRELSEEERKIPQVKEIFHLLTMQHPNYSNFIIEPISDWAWAQKKSSAKKNLVINTEYHETYKDVFSKSLIKLRKEIKKYLSDDRK